MKHWYRLRENWRTVLTYAIILAIVGGMWWMIIHMVMEDLRALP